MKLKFSNDLIIDGLVNVRQIYDRTTNFDPRTDIVFSDIDLDEFTVNKIKSMNPSYLTVLDSRNNEVTTVHVNQLEAIEKYVEQELRVILHFS